ncbi:MAG: NAD(P)/FAD-dependent oxidoreductase [Gammaproteobacteria bacterium]|jgi:predicted Rossmann fold flavoprotein|nr:NAD(P)/FAD-dependent oxidoreductase [Gammaproteobacteria bacterium]
MYRPTIQTDVLIIGASASGLMCAMGAGRRGRRVVVLDHANRAGKKILISGGGRCNFTNQEVSADHYRSHNPHFCKSALSRFTQWDFIALLDQYQIAYHERDHGRLFCDHSAGDILSMLLAECSKSDVEISLNQTVGTIRKEGETFIVEAEEVCYQAGALVMASGGLSIPKMGASPIGYKIAKQFGHHIWPTTAGLVPLTLQREDKERFGPLSGIAVEAVVRSEHHQFRENILFTHRGLSGPAILQISSYWNPGEFIQINFLPDLDMADLLNKERLIHPKSQLKSIINRLLPRRLVLTLLGQTLAESTLHSLSPSQLDEVAERLQNSSLQPNGSEGYRTAEVTLGGVDCNELSSKTMESARVSGLYFVGEVVDVTGWLGGYNLQWAWSSGWSAGEVV